MVSLIWATRGRSWGFGFLLRGGYRDPLAAYERAFAGMESERAVCRRVGGRVALRFPDPLDRNDTAGRVIPHDFVVMGPLADQINSIADGLDKIWPLVADFYAQIWSSGTPPTAEEVQSAFGEVPADPT